MAVPFSLVPGFRLLAWFTLVTLFIAADALGETAKYRLTWRDDPATTLSVGWVQEDGGDCAELAYAPRRGIGSDWKRISAVRTVQFLDMKHCFARLSGLLPDSEYDFELKDATSKSPLMWFRTAPAGPETPFTLVAGGDSRNYSRARRRANRIVAQLRPLAVLFAGDMTDRGAADEWAQWLDDWQRTRSDDGRMYPVVVARGNHESSDQVLERIFDTPPPPLYHALSLGGGLMRVYTLNTEITIGGDQTGWLQNDLETHQAVTWKIAQYHKPIRPHVGKKREGDQQYAHWAPLFQKYGVRLAIECDAHTVKTTWPIRPSKEGGSDEGFARDDDNGTVYVGEGCWGAPLRSDDDRKSWTRSSGRFNQVKWIRVTSERLDVLTIKVDNADEVGQVADASPFRPSRNLDIWTPDEGAVVSLLPSAATAWVSREPQRAPKAFQLLSGSIDYASQSRLELGGLPTGTSMTLMDSRGKEVRTFPALGGSRSRWTWPDAGIADDERLPAGKYYLKVRMPESSTQSLPVRVLP